MELKLDNINPSILNNYKQLFSGVSSFSAGRSRVGSGSDVLRRWKLVPKSDHLQVIPVMLHVPFNPETGEELAEAMPIPLSVRGAISYLKYCAAKNSAVLAALAQALDTTEDKLQFTELEATDADVELFKPLRNILVYGATVMSVRPADSKFSFGSPYRVDVAYDAESGRYIDDPSNPLVYTLHQMESALCAIKIKQAKDANDAAGDNRRTEKEMETIIKDIWDKRCFSNPYFLGTTRILSFPTNRSCELTEAVTAGWNKEISDLRKFEYYIKVNKSIRETFESILNSKYDRYEDFLLIRVNVPEFDDNTRASAAQAINRSGASRDDAIEETLKDFIEVYRAFRDSQDLWSEKAIRRIFEYRSLSDDQAIAYFRGIMPGLKEFMKTPDIINKYREVIDLVDSEVSSELLEAAIMGETAPALDYSSELNAQPVISEDTPGYGGDSMDAAPTGLGVTESDKAALEAAMDPTAAFAAALAAGDDA